MWSYVPTCFYFFTGTLNCAAFTAGIIEAVLNGANFVSYMHGSRSGDRGSGPPPPPGESQSCLVHYQYWSGSHGKSQLPRRHSMLGHHWPASKTPFKWRFRWWADDGQLLVVFVSYLPLSTQKKMSELDPL